jgi:hypothetical protein
MSGHVAPKSMYIAVWIALLAGTILTVLAAEVDLGALNNVVMLLILFGLTMQDYLTRGWVEGTAAGVITPFTGR